VAFASIIGADWQRGAAVLKRGTEAAVKHARRNCRGDSGQVAAAAGSAPASGA